MFDNPKRGRSGETERHGSERVGKAGAQDQEGGTIDEFTCSIGPARRSSKARVDAAKAETSHKVMEGSDQANGSQRQAGISPVRIHSGSRASVAKRTNAAAMPGPEVHVGIDSFGGRVRRDVERCEEIGRGRRPRSSTLCYPEDHANRIPGRPGGRPFEQTVPLSAPEGWMPG